MYIDVVPEEVIWMVNWLHYLNYEKKQTSDTRALARSFKCHQIGLDSKKQEKKWKGVRKKENKKINGTASARNENER